MISLYIGTFHIEGKPLLFNLDKFEVIDFTGEKTKILTTNGNSFTVDESYDDVMKEFGEVIIIHQKDPNDPKENGNGN